MKIEINLEETRFKDLVDNELSNFTYQNIINCCTGKTKTHKGYKFKYKKDD